eukprot:jgi/Mesvir1/16479/Mv10037-RA.1
MPPEDDGQRIVVKLGLLGDAQIGKSSLMVNFCEARRCDEDYVQTLGVNFMERTLKVRDTEISFSIWDLGGQPEFAPMLPLVCNDAAALVFMFDLSRRSTLNSVKQWYRQARQLNKSAVAVLVGTKYDIFANLDEREQAMTTKQARQYARAMDAPLIFVSTRSSINVHRMFKLPHYHVLANCSDVKNAQVRQLVLRICDGMVSRTGRATPIGSRLVVSHHGVDKDELTEELRRLACSWQALNAAKGNKMFGVASKVSSQVSSWWNGSANSSTEGSTRGGQDGAASDSDSRARPVAKETLAAGASIAEHVEEFVFNVPVQLAIEAYNRRAQTPHRLQASYLKKIDVLSIEPVPDAPGTMKRCRRFFVLNDAPQWIQKLCGMDLLEGYEEAVWNEAEGVMRIHTKNVSLSDYLRMTEECTYNSRGGDPNVTSKTMVVRIQLNLSGGYFGLKSKLEQYILSKYVERIALSREVDLLVLEEIKAERGMVTDATTATVTASTTITTADGTVITTTTLDTGMADPSASGVDVAAAADGTEPSTHGSGTGSAEVVVPGSKVEGEGEASIGLGDATAGQGEGGSIDGGSLESDESSTR